MTICPECRGIGGAHRIVAGRWCPLDGPQAKPAGPPPIVRGVQTCGNSHPDHPNVLCELADGHAYHRHMAARLEQPTAPVYHW